MEHKRPRVTLDDPELKSRLRYVRRSPAYDRRPAHYSSQLVTDILPPPSKPNDRPAVKKEPKPNLTSAKVHERPVKPVPEGLKVHRQARRTGTTASYRKPMSSVGQPNTNRPPEKPRITAPVREHSPHKDTIFERLSPKKVISKLSWRPALLYGAAAVLFAVGIYVGLGGWHANHQVQAQAKHLQKIVNGNTSSDATPKKKSEQSVPSTKPVSRYTIADYHVAPDLPRYIKIPKINVFARVLQTGVDSDGHLGVPPDIYDTAWYTGSSKPGEPGATLIDGHLDGYNAAGVFWNLHKLVKGDKIQIERGDGKTLTYKVVKKKSYKTGHVDMASALVPAVPGKSGLNLITCNGKVGKSTDWHYTERLIVYAIQT